MIAINIPDLSFFFNFQEEEDKMAALKVRDLSLLFGALPQYGKASLLWTELNYTVKYCLMADREVPLYWDHR